MPTCAPRRPCASWPRGRERAEEMAELDSALGPEKAGPRYSAQQMAQVDR
jgi:hypothetical protein